MSSPGIGAHLKDLRRLQSTKIEDAIISQQDDHVLSRYGDIAWDLSPFLPARNLRTRKINFDLKFSNGTCLVGPENAALLQSVKRFLYTRWRVKAPHSRKYISAKSVMNNWGQLKALLKWMVEHDINSFSGLTQELCLSYARDMNSALASGTKVLNLQILTTYFDLREHLDDQLPMYPWGDAPPTLLAKYSRKQLSNGSRPSTTEVIPLRILRLLVQGALDYIENRASNLLTIRDRVCAIQAEERVQMESRHHAAYPQGFASIYNNEIEYLSVKVSHAASSRLNKACAEVGIASFLEFKQEIFHLRTACYILCAVFSGMRDSELASLEVGCFAKRQGFDGEEFCWLKGMTYKLEEDPKPAEWMVPEIVGLAVDVATRLGAPQRERCRARIAEKKCILHDTAVLKSARSKLVLELVEAEKHQYALMFTEHSNGRLLALSGLSASRGILKFAEQLGINIEQDDIADVIKHEKVKIGQGWPFAVHQFRRTFAVYVARNLMGDVRYLREHFKHWSIDMTLHYTRHDEGVDSTVFSDVLTERDELQIVILEKWMTTDASLSGGGGKRIVRFRERGDIKTVHDMHDFCRRLGEDVFIRGTGHSWCMSSGNGCGGHGLYDAIRCIGCGEGVIDSANLQVWRGIRQQQIDVLSCDDLGASSWERSVQHLREAETILIELGDSFEPFPVPASPLMEGHCV